MNAIRRSVQTYVAQQTTSSSGPWTQCYVGKASGCTVTELTSGTQYWVQIRAIGAAGPSAWSDPATKRATLAAHGFRTGVKPFSPVRGLR